LLLVNCVVIAARAGEQAKAKKAWAELEANPQFWSTSALRALVTGARAELFAAENNAAAAITLLRSAVQQWHAIESPLAAAHGRYRLAEWLLADGDHDTAEIEISAACAAFERVGARVLVERCRQLRAKAGDKSVIPAVRAGGSGPLRDC
jgi:hypothetical protein